MIRVARSRSSESIRLPLRHNELPKETLSSQFDGAVGLKYWYQSDSWASPCSSWAAVPFIGEAFEEPPGGWESPGRVYVVVLASADDGSSGEIMCTIFPVTCIDEFTNTNEKMCKLE